MVIGSHNSWSYRRARRWWLRPFQFVARCQRVDIRRQYNDYGVRCFDLRIRFDADGDMEVAHGWMVYDVGGADVERDIEWLNQAGDCFVRVVHEVRTDRQRTRQSVKLFQRWCREAVERWPCIEFWCGRNLATWEKDYEFGDDPTCWEMYSSVCKPKWIDDWWPWLFARLNNKKILATIDSQEPRADILLIDYVDIR